MNEKQSPNNHILMYLFTLLCIDSTSHGLNLKDYELGSRIVIFPELGYIHQLQVIT